MKFRRIRLFGLASMTVFIAAACGNSPLKTAMLASTADARGQKILLVSATDNRQVDVGIELAMEAMQQQGLAVEHYVATSGQEIQLENQDGSPRFSGIVLTNDKLLRQDESGAWVSGLNESQWERINQYEVRHNQRRVSLSAYPSVESGVAPAGEPTGEVVQLTVVDESLHGVKGLAAVGNFTLQNSWLYPAKVVDPAKALPLLAFAGQDAAGEKIAAALVKESDGREHMVFFFTQGKLVEASVKLAPVWSAWLLEKNPGQEQATVAGSWASSFEFSDRFQGIVNIEERPGHFVVAGDVGSVKVRGPGMMAGGVLAGAWVEAGSDVALVSLSDSGSGGLAGRFLSGSDGRDKGTVELPGVSLENLAKQGGSFAIKVQSERHGELDGVVDFAVKEKTLQVSALVAGVEASGVAYRLGDEIFISLSMNENSGLFFYKMMGADILDGMWLRQDVDSVFKQKLMRK